VFTELKMDLEELDFCNKFRSRSLNCTLIKNEVAFPTIGVKFFIFWHMAMHFLWHDSKVDMAFIGK
jgi:hypothetical protein